MTLAKACLIADDGWICCAYREFASTSIATSCAALLTSMSHRVAWLSHRSTCRVLPLCDQECMGVEFPSWAFSKTSYVNWSACVIRSLRKRNPEQRQRKPRAVLLTFWSRHCWPTSFFPMLSLPESAKHLLADVSNCGGAVFTRAKWHHENMCGGVCQSFHIISNGRVL